MVRPTIYHTEEERRQARNEKSRRSYHNTRHKYAISLRREARKSGVRSVLDGLLCEESSSKKEKKKPDADSLEYYVVRVERLAAKLTNIIGSSPYDYFESCVVQYIDNTASDVIPNVIPRIRRLESKVMKYSPEVLKRAGYGMEWTRVQEVAKRISDVLYCLHELVSCTSSAMQDVVDAHAKKGLMYQRLPL